MSDKNSSEIYSRRRLAQAAALGGLWPGIAYAATATPSPDGPPSNAANTMFDVRQFGAKGDGQSDDTKAIQAAIDAGIHGGAVFLPPGVYLSSELHLRPHVSLIGIAGWSYRSPGGSVIRLGDPNAASLLNITGASGVSIDGLSLEGGTSRRKNTWDSAQQAGLRQRGGCLPNRAFEDRTLQRRRRATGPSLVFLDSPLHDRAQWRRRCIAPGVGRIPAGQLVLWEPRRRIRARGTRTHPVRSPPTGSNGTREGILLVGGDGYNITGNFFDRSGGCALVLRKGANGPCEQMSITGNFLKRSGKTAKPESYDSGQARFEGARGVTFSGNNLEVGRDDGGGGQWSPSYGIIYRDLQHCVISNNVLHDGAIPKNSWRTWAGNETGVVVKDNPGCLFQAKG
jgi:hypothetical protein